MILARNSLLGSFMYAAVKTGIALALPSVVMRSIAASRSFGLEVSRAGVWKRKSTNKNDVKLGMALPFRRCVPGAEMTVARIHYFERNIRIFNLNRRVIDSKAILCQTP